MSPEAARAGLAGDALAVAPLLLGSRLTSDVSGERVVVEVTEVEAYGGADDPASHAYRSCTARNAAMFGPPGVLYVYRSYGIHLCLNVVTGVEGEASAVLLRAGRVVQGAVTARRRRGERVLEKSLARGPGCLGQALGVSLDHNGLDLLAGGSVSLALSDPLDPSGIATGERVGVRLAHDRPWRFWVVGEPTVSAYRRSSNVRVRR